MLFIQKTHVALDHTQMMADLEDVLKISPWSQFNQIGLTHRLHAANPWQDAIGSLYDYETETHLGQENEFTEWCPGVPEYTKSQIINLARDQDFTIGRVRYMRLPPKRGLSVHHDAQTRFHYVLETNAHSYMFLVHQSGHVIGYHLPVDYQFYHVNTKLDHFVYNGGKTDRVHLVICAIKSAVGK